MKKWIMIIALSLSAVAFSQKIPHGVNLSWTWSGTGTPTFSVYRSTSSGSESKPALMTGLTTMSAVDTTAAVNVQYYYTFTATVGGVESAPSNEVGALIPVPPSPTGPSTSIY